MSVEGWRSRWNCWQLQLQPVQPQLLLGPPEWSPGIVRRWRSAYPPAASESILDREATCSVPTPALPTSAAPDPSRDFPSPAPFVPAPERAVPAPEGAGFQMAACRLLQ